MPPTTLAAMGVVAAAAVAQAAGSPEAAFTLLLLAIPVAVAAALAAFGEAIDRGDPLRSLQALLGAVALALIVLSAAARSPMLEEGVVPRLGVSALVACLTVYGTQALLTLGAAVRGLLARPQPVAADNA